MIRLLRTRLAAALCLSLLVAACDRGGATAPGGPGTAPPPAVDVAVVEATLRKVPVMIDTVGRTEGSKEVEIRARVSGILEKRAYTEGSSVTAGTELFRIDRTPFDIALAQAQATLAQETARNDQARREQARLAALARERAISQREADDADANLKASDATLAAAQARVRDASLNLSYTSVVAPIAGIAGRAQRSDGSLVTAGTDSSLLTTLAQTDPLWFRFAVSEDEHALLRTSRGGKVSVTLLRPDGSEHPVAGRLNFEASTVDTRLGTVQMRAEFANPKLAWLPGQYARARVVIGEEEAMLVPQTAVMQGDRGQFVWVIDDKGGAQPQPVTVGSWLGKDWIIRSGLPAGSKVIVDNLIRMRPGTPVTVRAGAAS